MIASHHYLHYCIWHNYHQRYLQFFLLCSLWKKIHDIFSDIVFFLLTCLLDRNWLISQSYHSNQEYFDNGSVFCCLQLSILSTSSKFKIGLVIIYFCSFCHYFFCFGGDFLFCFGGRFWFWFWFYTRFRWKWWCK